MKLLPSKRPYPLGWFFDWGVVSLGGSCFYIGRFACSWRKKNKFIWKPLVVLGRRYADNDKEPDMWRWLKFNISFAGGWGIGLDYPQ